ncbi:hypothetical protein VNI00_005471 [Paramarasmius palmivorus]|uniref:Uncharacterized protein n=1 Tax=Paramarasmius palmivorus TaxID=297713 RepID=A0AAW0DFC1_9AGAR
MSNGTVEEFRPEIDEIKKLFGNATQRIQDGGSVNLGGKSVSGTGDEFQRMTNDTAEIINYVLGHVSDDEFDPAIKLCAEVFKPVGSFLHICVQKVTGLSDVLKEKLKDFVELGKNLGADISSDLNP